MGNTLVFVCPHCGHEGEKSVIQTDVLALAIVTGDGGAEIRGRTRQRYCGNCKSQFKTSEISTGALDDLVARDQLATNLTRRLQTTPGSIASDACRSSLPSCRMRTHEWSRIAPVLPSAETTKKRIR